MGYFVVICVLGTVALASGLQIHPANDVIWTVKKRDIPVRCIINSVTPVTCDNVNVTENLLPHPDDCQLFYYCLSSDTAPLCRQCPAGLHFNPRKRVCDFPKQAGCQLNGTVTIDSSIKSNDSSANSSKTPVSTQTPSIKADILLYTTEDITETVTSTEAPTTTEADSKESFYTSPIYTITTRRPVYTTRYPIRTTKRRRWWQWG